MIIYQQNMGFNKIFVLGAGAIGSVYGALLSKKNDVTLIGEKEHILTIKSNGLRISGDINKNFKVKAEEKIRKIPPNTLILLTTKAHQTKKAIESIKKLLRKDTVILILQNGLGQEESAERAAGNKCRVLRGITLMFVEFLTPGRIKCGLAETILPSTNEGKKIAKILKESGLRVKLSKGMKKEIWKKLVVNCLLNPLTALFKIRNNEIAAAVFKPLRKKIVKECLEVAAAEGVHFTGDFEKEIAKKLPFYKNYSSMCQDIMKGRKTEINFLNGKIAELAKKHNLETPANEIMCYLIKFLEDNPVRKVF